MPALFTKISIESVIPFIHFTNSIKEVLSATSQVLVCILIIGNLSCNSLPVCSRTAAFLAQRKKTCPCLSCANASAIALPNPFDAPVITMFIGVLFMSEVVSCNDK